MNQSSTSLWRIVRCLLTIREREKRKSNVIIYNLPESRADDGETKKTQEAESIKKVCDSADIQFEIEHFIRLGEKKGPNARPRPLKVVLQNEADKQKLVRNGTKLKVSDELGSVSITPDYTVRQRQLNSQMKAGEAKWRATDPSFTYRRLKDELSGRAATSPVGQQEEVDLHDVTPSQTNKSTNPRNISHLAESSQRNIREESTLRRQNRPSTSVGRSFFNHSQKTKGAATGSGPPLGRGSPLGRGAAGSMGSRR